MSAEERPLVSVCLLTYNHAPYIAQAIESILAQETNFPFELLIGEDESSDGTRDTVREFAARYPGRIQPIYRSRRDVIYVRGRATGRFNFTQTILAARGKYVALLEGDDFWCDSGKLQRQFDHMESDPTLALCFHDIRNLMQDAGTYVEICDTSASGRYTLEDIIRSRIHIHTSSMFFRRELIAQFPEWIKELVFADVPLCALLAEKGDIGRVDGRMSVHRTHSGGGWTEGVPYREQSPRGWAVQIRHTESVIHFYEVIQKHLFPRFDDVIRDKLSMLYYDLAWLQKLSGDRVGMRRSIGNAIRRKPFNSQTPTSAVLRAWVVALLPGFLLSNGKSTNPGS